MKYYTENSGSSGNSSSMQMLTLSSNCFSLPFTGLLLILRYSLFETETIRIGFDSLLPSSRHKAWNLRPKREDFDEEGTTKGAVRRVGDRLKERREMEKVAGERSSEKVAAAAREIAKAMAEEGGRSREQRREEERGSI